VAEYILGAILMMGKRLKDMLRSVESGGWRPESDGSARNVSRQSRNRWRRFCRKPLVYPVDLTALDKLA